MGRLYKAKVDKIQELSKQGYLQREIAEKLGVHVKTVRKYDPTNRSISSGSNPTGSVPESIRNVIALMLDYIEFIEINLQLDKVRNGYCPRCSKKQFEFDAIKFIYQCGNCGYILLQSSDICRNCFAENSYDEEQGYSSTCKECGYKMY